jgi:2'-phosphotransferase
VLTIDTQLNNRNIRPLKVTLAELQDLVAQNDKQRFKLIPLAEAPSAEDGDAIATTASTSDNDNDDPSQWLIRANQGHSIKVDEEGLLEPITLESELPSTVVHGTTSKAWPLILSTGGLRKMTRNHIHFAAGLPAGFQSLENAQDATEETKKEPVISGMRNSSSILIYVDIKKALEGGLKFWRSANGVILSEGDKKGIIPVEYFQRVEERRKGLGVIMTGGQVIKDAAP